MMLRQLPKQVLTAVLVLAGLTSALAQSDQRKFSQGNSGFRKTPKTRQLTPLKVKSGSPVRKASGNHFSKALGDTLVYENFESGTWPANWQRLNVDGRPAAASVNATFGSEAWVTTTEATGVTNQVAASTSWLSPVGTANRWMVSEPIVLNGAYKMSWSSMARDPQFPDGYEVRLSTDHSSTITNGNVLSKFSNVLFSVDADQTTGLESHNVSLADYQGDTVRIAFRNNSTDMFVLLIDDILVYRIPDKDVSAGVIFSPADNVYDCSKTSFPARISVSNPGATTAQNITVQLRSTGPVNDTITMTIDSLAAEATDTLVMPGGLDLSVVGDYALRLEVSMAGDEISGNNTSSGSYAHLGPDNAPFQTDFDGLNPDSTLPNGWFTTSRFSPFNSTAGMNGGQSIELPVFNNLGTLGSQPVCGLVTSKYTGIAAGNYLSMKYKLTILDGTEYSMADGDSISVNVYKNCQFAGTAFSITASNHEASNLYRKMYASLDSFDIAENDLVSFSVQVKASDASAVFLMEMDDFSIGAAGSDDIAMIDLEQLPFSQIKKYQLGTLRFKGNVINEGLNDVSPVRIEAAVSPLGIVDTARISVLGSGYIRSFTTSPGITIADAGEYTVNLSASSPGMTDSNPDNNSASFTLNVTDSTMAKDFGDPLDFAYLQYGAGSGGKRIMANAIATTQKDTMTSVSVYVGPIIEDCQAKAFFANKNAAGNWVEDSSAVIVDVTVDMANSWVPLRFYKNQNATRKGKPVAANSENLYGVKIRGGNLMVGFNFENATTDGSFIWLGTSFLGTQDVSLGSLNGPFGIFIRANFGRLSTIITGMNQVQQSLQHAEVAPNPSQGDARLVFASKDGGSVGIQVFNLNGQMVNESTQVAFSGVNRLEIPSKGLQKGMYLVKVSAAGYTATKKMIIE